MNNNQEKLFRYWEWMHGINNLLIQCTGYKIKFTLEELDRLDTSKSSYYDIILEKSKVLPLSDNPGISTNEYLYELLNLQKTVSGVFSAYKKKFDETMRSVNYLGTDKIFTKTFDDNYGFIELQNRIQVILFNIFRGFHISYVTGSQDKVEYDEDIQQYVFDIPYDESIEKEIRYNKERISKRNKIPVDLGLNYFEKKREEAAMWQQVYEDQWEYNDK